MDMNKYFNKRIKSRQSAINLFYGFIKIMEKSYPYKASQNAIRYCKASHNAGVNVLAFTN